MLTRARLTFATLVAACVPTPERGPAQPEPPPVDPATPWSPEGTPLASRPELRVAVSAPARVTYDAEAIGAGEPHVAIRLTNTGPRPAPIGRVGATFSVVRDGVAFPCPVEQRPPRYTHEPSSLAAGESFAFERALDCSMPLVGRYEVRVYVGFAGADPTVSRDLAGSATIDVIGDGLRVPRELPRREGLFVFLTGARATPMPPEAVARGDYHVVVALIDGTSRAIRLGPASVSFLVYKRGSSTPCASAAVPIALPASLAPGAMHTVTVPVSCAPAAEGHYEVVGRLALAPSPEVEIGRVALEVTSDPRLFAPPF